MSVKEIDPCELVSSPAAAQMLGVKPATLNAWRHEKRGPAYVKAGRRIFYRLTDIRRWLAGGLVGEGAR